jgi:hypothetical protein
MLKIQLLSYLDRLGLSQTEAATLLSVNPRTLRRWIENPDELPGPAEQALKAWDKLNTLGMAWRPDGLELGESTAEYAEQVSLLRNHAIGLSDLLDRVAARGGPAAPWRVDVEGREATLGPMTVHFYRLPNGGFSPSTYRRRDSNPDTRRDSRLLEDAYACIAAALATKKRKKQR